MPEKRESEVCAAEPKAPSAIARRLEKVRRSTLAVVSRRERLPQPLFWSVFHTELKIIKAAREKERLLKKILLGIGD